MEKRMARDVEVLQQVMQTHDVTANQLANRSGLAAKSIYKYLSDQRTLPSDVLRAAFELTCDLRLLGLISGIIPITHQFVFCRGPACNDARPQVAKPARIPPVGELLPRTSKSIEELAKALPYIGKILEDGKIDDSDRVAIQRFHGHAAAAMADISRVDAALDAHERKVAP
ncbi:MAG: hypothetical protein ABII12_03265 [Planctomycetota bacterium]